MGYWQPPTGTAFDPCSRPLVYSGPRNAPIPNEFDAALLAMATVASDKITPPPLIAKQGIGGAYYQMLNGGPPPGMLSKTTKERLHGLLSSEQTFTRWFYGDLPDGGLPPDAVNPDGSFTVNYWDMSDDNLIRRKSRTFQIFYFNGKPEVHDRIVQWNRNSQAWEDEGQDAEREIMTNGDKIVQVCGAVAQVTLAAASAATGGLLAPVASAFAYGWNFVLQYMASQGQVIHVSIDDLASFGTSFFIGVLGAQGVVGDLAREGVQAFNGAMTKVMNDISTTTNSLFGSSSVWGGSIAQLASTYSKNVNLVVDNKQLMQFAKQYFAGQLPQPPQITARNTQSAVPDLTKPPAFADLPSLAFVHAGRAYAESDPRVQLQVRRNLIAFYRGRATIVASDDVSAAAHAVNITQNTDAAATDIGSLFDQFMTTLSANDILSAVNPLLASPSYATMMSGALAVTPSDPKAAQSDLMSFVRQLKSRYGL